jgi:NAD(P)-dependent dehydrogenase (short-subunit alcohol dehydrogenase family)
VSETQGRLNGKIAFLAGATTGIGQATAEAFAAEGASVAVAGRTVAAGEAVVAAIRAAGGRAIFVATDVTDPDNVRRSIEATVREYGRLDVLFNNAGGSTPQDGKVTDAPDEEFWRALRLDLHGTWSCCKYGIPALIRSGGGSVINMASLAAITPDGRPRRVHVCQRRRRRPDSIHGTRVRARAHTCQRTGPWGGSHRAHRAVARDGARRRARSLPSSSSAWSSPRRSPRRRCSWRPTNPAR